MATGRHLSLEQLERRRRPEPSFKSRLAMTCHCLCQKPIGDFTVEDHRIMIGQKLGLKHLLPLAIEILQDDPLARGDFFPGDLLRNVVRHGAPEFRAKPELAQQVAAICKRAIETIKEDPDCFFGKFRSELIKEFADFRNRWNAG